AEMQREAAEPADLDAVTLRQRVAHDLEDLLDRKLHVFRGQMLLLGCDELDEFRFGHARARCCSFESSPRPAGRAHRRVDGCRIRGARRRTTPPPRRSWRQLLSWLPICSLSRSPRLVPLEVSPVR